MPYVDICLNVISEEHGQYLVNIVGPCLDAVRLKPTRSVETTMNRVKELLEVEFHRWPLEQPLPQATLQGIGKDLFTGFFRTNTDDAPPQNHLWKRIEDNLKTIRRNFPGHEARLRLQFDPASELAVQPWETIHHNNGFLALSHGLSFVRSFPDSEHINTLPAVGAGPLNIVVVMSNPQDAPVDVEEEELRDCLGDLENVGQISLKFIKHSPGQSLFSQLTHYIAEIGGDAPHIVHIVAHGDYDESAGEGRLWLESEGGISQPVEATALVGALRQIRGLSLVVLNACHGGARIASKPFSSIAEKLIAAGIPAVVAMQFEVSNEAAVLFAETFYKSIASGLSIDDSVSSARRVLRGIRGDVTGDTSIEWCTPVLFLGQSYQDTTLIPPSSHQNLFEQAENWRRRQEFKKALSAYRLILRTGVVANDIREQAEKYKPLAAGKVNNSRINNLVTQHRHGQPTEVLAECDRILEDSPLNFVTQVREEAEQRIRKELDQVFTQGIAAAVERNWADAEKFFAKSATHANKVLRRARRCKSAREYQRPTEIAYDFCWLFNCAENYVTNNCLEEAKNAFRNIISLRLNAFPLLKDLQPLRSEARQSLSYIDARLAEAIDDWVKAHEAYQSLPENFREVRSRLFYVEGRLAEQQENWAKALHCYQQLGLESRDLKFRLPYVEGRVAEATDNWKQAVTAYASLSSVAYGDSSERLAYAQGREADAEASRTGDWHRVIEAFGILPDEYREGDVRRRLCHARGRLSAAQEHWETAIREFRLLDDEYHDGVVGRFRLYASGRVAETHEQWESAIKAFGIVLDHFKDARDRQTYAKARLAEQQENWAEAVTHFASLPDVFRGGEIAERKAYAVGRMAIQERRWEDGAKAIETISHFHDTSFFLLYAKSRIAALRGDWQAALSSLSAIPTSLEHGEVGKYLTYVQGKFYESRGQWRAALEAYQPLPENFEDVTERRCRLGYLLEVAPWMDGLTYAPLVRDPVCTWSGVFPYDTLAPAGISPASSTGDVNAASFVLMEKGLMTPEGRVAWDQLRSVRNRLKVDAAMYAMHRAEEIRDFQQRIEIVSQAEFMRQAREAAAEDAPLLLLISGNWKEAISEWEKLQQQNPQNASVAHALAIAYLNRARELEDKGSYEEADRFWERTIANWAMLLTDSAYWLSWQRERTACYKEAVSDNDIATLRSELAEHVAEQLTKYADRHQMEGRDDRAAKCQQLALAFEVELEGAKALKEVGGLLVKDNQEARLCGGLLLVRHLSLEQTLSKLILELDQTAEREAEEAEDVIASLENLENALQERTPQQRLVVTPQMLHRLRCTFSELGKADVLLERHRYEEVWQALPEEYLLNKISDLPVDCELYQGADADHFAACKDCQKFTRSNPAYLSFPYRSIRLFRDVAELAMRSHLAIAETALTSSELKAEVLLDQKFATPLSHWQQAIANSKNAGTQVRTKQAIVRVALGRATALEKGRGQQRGSRLTEAIDLLNAVRELVGGVEEAQMKGKLSELLTDRGVWFGYGCNEWESPDYERAANDLRKALELNPGSLHACDNMARALIFHASNLQVAGEQIRPLELLAESLSLLDAGFRRFGDSTQLQSVLRHALEALEDIVRGGQSINKTLDELDQVLRNLSPEAVVSDIKAIVKSAKQKLKAGDVTFAVLELVRAVRLDAGNELARRELIAAVQSLSTEGGNGHAQGSTN